MATIFVPFESIPPGPAVADPTRRAILKQLGPTPARVTDIAQKFPVSLNAISKHLMVLERAGLIQRDVHGRDHICRLDGQPLRQAVAWMEGFAPSGKQGWMPWNGMSWSGGGRANESAGRW